MSNIYQKKMLQTEKTRFYKYKALQRKSSKTKDVDTNCHLVRCILIWVTLNATSVDIWHSSMLQKSTYKAYWNNLLTREQLYS